MCSLLPCAHAPLAVGAQALSFEQQLEAVEDLEEWLAAGKEEAARERADDTGVACTSRTSTWGYVTRQSVHALAKYFTLYQHLPARRGCNASKSLYSCVCQLHKRAYAPTVSVICYSASICKTSVEQKGNAADGSRCVH